MVKHQQKYVSMKYLYVTFSSLTMKFYLGVPYGAKLLGHIP